MKEGKNMAEERSRGYFFLNRPITTAQYYMVAEYTQLDYIDSHTIGMYEEMEHYRNCLDLCETVLEPSWREARKTIPDEGERVEYVLQKENVITAMELARSIRGLSLMLPHSIEQISTEQWKHFLKWYDAKTLNDYITVTFTSIPKELKEEIPLQFDTMNDDQKTEVYKNLLNKITETKGLSFEGSQKPMAY